MYGLIAGILEKKFSKDSKITLILMCIGLTFIFELGIYILNILLFNSSIQILSFLKIVIIEMIFNGLLMIIIYPIIKKVSLLCDEIYNNKNIITKYF